MLNGDGVILPELFERRAVTWNGCGGRAKRGVKATTTSRPMDGVGFLWGINRGVLVRAGAPVLHSRKITGCRKWQNGSLPKCSSRGKYFLASKSKSWRVLLNRAKLNVMNLNIVVTLLGTSRVFYFISLVLYQTLSDTASMLLLNIQEMIRMKQ